MKKLLIIIVVLLCHTGLFANDNPPTNPNKRVIDGIECKRGEYPFMGAIVERNTQNLYCGCSLISPNWVITAASCIQNETIDSIDILLGIHNIKTDKIPRFKPKRLVQHDQYDNYTLDSDIALIELDTFTSFESLPILENQIDLTNKMATIIGWGKTGEHKPYPEELMQATVPIVSSQECHNAYQGEITDNMFCAGFYEGGKDACTGDGGGPLFVNIDNENRLVGLVSWGEGCGEPEYYGVYTKVQNYIEWINNTINAIPNEVEEIFVSPTGNNNNSGKSKLSPFKTITHAVSLLDSTKQSIIHLGPGVYSKESNDETFPIKLKSYMKLSGSGLDSTILDANKNDQVIIIENSRYLSIENLTIMNGYSIDNGGGLLCINSNPELKNITFKNNDAVNYGGAIYFDNSTSNLYGITIANNNSTMGGGLYYNNNCNISIMRSVISDNWSSETGSALFVNNKSQAIIVNSTIVNNSSKYGGALKFYNNSKADFSNSIIWGNKPENIDHTGKRQNVTKPVIGDKEVTAKDINEKRGSQCYKRPVRIHNTISFFYTDIPKEQYIGKSYRASQVLKIVNLDGNFSKDPLFINLEKGNYTLKANSPCIDAGAPDLDGDGKDWSIDEDDRDLDNTRLDMGALAAIQNLENYQGFAIGDKVLIENPNGNTDLDSEMDKYIGKTGIIKRLCGIDNTSQYVVKVEVDNETIEWLIANLAPYNNDEIALIYNISIQGENTPSASVQFELIEDWIDLSVQSSNNRFIARSDVQINCKDEKCEVTAIGKNDAYGVSKIEVFASNGNTTDSFSFNLRRKIPFTCEEKTDGNIDVVGVKAKCGDFIQVAIRIQNSPNIVNVFGFNLFYDPGILTYSGFTRGSLGTDFTHFDVTDRYGYLKVGGIKFGSGLSKGSSGNLVFIDFKIAPKVSSCNHFEMSLYRLIDDLEGWQASCGCVGGCNGDVNMDNRITPIDALYAFDKTMSICPTSEGITCPEVCCDVNADNECTPNDALCIFNHFMEKKSCLDYLDY